jgi:hypothetical protein
MMKVEVVNSTTVIIKGVHFWRSASLWKFPSRPKEIIESRAKIYPSIQCSCSKHPMALEGDENIPPSGKSISVSCQAGDGQYR